METVETSVRMMEAELREWGSRLDKLLAKADKAGARATIDYRDCLDDLKERYDDAEGKLAEFKAAGVATRENFKDGVANAWSELATAFTRLSH